nr:RNA-directed DNA polymerase, eukaryota [Tanacetum cinerariifolium]
MLPRGFGDTTHVEVGWNDLVLFWCLHVHCRGCGCYADATLEHSQVVKEDTEARALSAGTSELEKLFKKEDSHLMKPVQSWIHHREVGPGPLYSGSDSEGECSMMGTYKTNTADSVCPSRVHAMLASRACRSSVMIGDPLGRNEMKKILLKVIIGGCYRMAKAGDRIEDFKDAVNKGLAALAVTAEFKALALGTTISVTGVGVFAAVVILERITSIFNGFWIDNSLTISHLFYADDAVFIGDWSNGNLKGILNILNCFSLLSGMSINLKKSQILSMGISDSVVTMATKDLGCSVMKVPFMYLGVMVGGNMSLVKAWDSTIDKLLKRLSKSDSTTLVAAYPSIWSSIINEFHSLIDQGVDIFSHCEIRIGNGVRTRFWKDYWLGDYRLQGMFPRLYALESNKDITVAEKLLASLVYSFRRDVRGGAKTQ